jgi:hypothetical protein
VLFVGPKGLSPLHAIHHFGRSAAVLAYNARRVLPVVGGLEARHPHFPRIVVQARDPIPIELSQLPSSHPIATQQPGGGGDSDLPPHLQQGNECRFRSARINIAPLTGIAGDVDAPLQVVG